MGKFAAHINLVASGADDGGHAYVDYDRLTSLANECLSGADGNHTCVAFRQAWAEELSRASSYFDKQYADATKAVIDAVFETEEYIPDHPALASPDPHVSVEILMKSKGREFVIDLLHDFKALLQCASLNSEALHLALRKYDSRVAVAAKEAGLPPPKSGVAGELLPKLYASTIYHATGARSLAGDLQAVRDTLNLDDGEEGEAESYCRGCKEEGEREMSAGGLSAEGLSASSESAREDEYKWFMDHAAKLEDRDLASLVAHRGFHCENDNSVTRPIENSLSSFEYAWAAGVHLAECDVGVTKDERIIMAHDSDFQRLALLSDCKAKTVVKDLTLSDIMRMPLKHGNRPPLLADVLRSASAIGDHAKLVIEIKPGNSEIVDPLMSLFERQPSLLSRVAVIMSFDTYIMDDIADRFKHRTTLSRARKAVSYPTIAGRSDWNVTSIPKLLVLTAFADHNDGKKYLLTSVKDGFEGLKLPAGGGIDGVYIEYEPEMLEPEGQEKMRELAKLYTVGVWMLKPRDPDALSVAKRLVQECGVSFVNTDFHRDFFST